MTFDNSVGAGKTLENKARQTGAKNNTPLIEDGRGVIGHRPQSHCTLESG